MKYQDQIEMAACWFDVSTFDARRGCFTMQTFTDKYGDIKFYPKKNKIHIMKTNRWIEHGHNWLKTICTNMEKGIFKDVEEKSNLKDTSIMKFGKFKGSTLEKIPDWWLIWIEKELRGQDGLDSFRKNLLLYIDENR